MVSTRRALKYGGIGVLGLVGLLVVGFLLGFLGVPAVDQVENRFAAVNESTTTVDTDLVVRNPNPVGVSLGDLAIDYGIFMNDVPMANGSKQGISIGTGRSNLSFSTAMSNGQIPEWWYTHVRAGETTDVLVDVDLSHGLLGGRSVGVPQEQTIETDIVGQFNDTSTRPVNAGNPVVSDPVLYINETAANYGSPVTPERTPIDMAFTVYNPKPYPYTVTEIGYVIRMNGVRVGEGRTEREYVVGSRDNETLEATTAIRNERLDDWWVSHLERDQVTELEIDFYVVVDPEATQALGEAVEPIRLDLDAFDHETTIETDIFGTKATDGLGDGASGPEPDGDDGSSEPTETEGGGDGATATPAPTETDDGSTASPTEADDDATATPTETEDDGPLPL